MRQGPAWMMQHLLKRFMFAFMTLCSLPPLYGQDLAPRAYVITPLHSNAVILTWAYYNGSIDYNGVLPVSGATGTYSVPIFSYYHSLDFFGRSANITATLPYGVGQFQGTVLGAENHLYRSGLLDSVYRLSINLKGGPAMPASEFAKWKQKVLLGASLKIIAPTGQYDPTKLVNWGFNRWSFKPEFGYSEAWKRRWILDGYAGVWFSTVNSDFWSRNIYFAGTRSQSQNPIGSFEGHLSYDLKPRFWASFDGNFWFGGKTSLDGVPNEATHETNSRLGCTVSVPLSKHQSLKVSYNDGTHIRVGGNYQNVSAAWQYSWLGVPK